DILSVGYDTGMRTLETNRENTSNIYTARQVTNLAEFGTNIAGDIMTANVMGGISTVVQAASRGINDTVQYNANIDSIQASIQNLEQQTARQRAILYTQGN